MVVLNHLQPFLSLAFRRKMQPAGSREGRQPHVEVLNFIHQSLLPFMLGWPRIRAFVICHARTPPRHHGCAPSIAAQLVSFASVYPPMEKPCVLDRALSLSLSIQRPGSDRCRC